MPIMPFDILKALLGMPGELEDDWDDAFRDEDDEDPVEDDGDAFDMEHVISLIPEQEMRGLLLDLAAMGSEARDLIAIRYSDDPDEDLLRRLQKSLRRMEASCINYDFHILDVTTFEYVGKLTRFLELYVDELIRREKYTVANQLTNSVYETLERHFDEDLHGELCDVVEACIDRWNEIRKHASGEMLIEMLDWLDEAIGKDDHGVGATDVLLDFLDGEFTDPVCLEHRLIGLEEEIEELDAQGDLRSDDDDRFLAGAVVVKLDYLGQLDRPQEERDALYQKYWALHDVRMAYVEDLSAEERIDEAIGVLLESARMDQNAPRELESVGNRLVELYQEPGLEQTPKSELILRLFADDSPDMDQLIQLKALCAPEEWAAYREKIFWDPLYSDIWYPLMEEEGLYKRMLFTISREDSLQDMDRYESELKSRFPEEVRKFYVSYVKEAAKSASNRSAYAGLTEYLKKIESYPDGEAAVKEITEDWKVRYARRSAMMDELRKAGY